MTAVQPPSGEDYTRPPPKGWNAFFIYHEPRLRRYLYALGARDSLLDDAAQMTLLEAFRSWDRLRNHPKQDAWLFTVARQRYAKVYKEHLRHGDLTDPVLFERICQDDTTARSDRRLDLLAALRRLSEQQREALVLRHFFDLPYAQIAEAIGVQPSSARALVSRALARLTELQQAEENEEGGCT